MKEKKNVNVTLENVSKIYRNTKGKPDVVAVRESNFTVNAGELVTLLGPSGCGKTTTLRMIAGFELPTSGRVIIGSEDVTMLPPNKRDTATVFQSYGLFPHLTVGENVAYGLKLRKLPSAEIKTKVQSFLDLVGLSDLFDRPPGQLSGGQQQRVALARSLIVEPSVLLLDEPLSNLDALLREQMRVEIRRIQQSLGITAIYVTHDRVEAMTLSDKVIVMRDGDIIQIGTPQEIYETPINKYVASFVGKVAYFPVELVEKRPYGGPQNADGISNAGGIGNTEGITNTAGAWLCRFGNKNILANNYAENLKPGQGSVIMARPESLRLAESGAGAVEGTVKMNVYLGHSVETFVDTPNGEVLVQVDDPASMKLFKEGAKVSIDFNQNRIRLLPNS